MSTFSDLGENLISDSNKEGHGQPKTLEGKISG